MTDDELDRYRAFARAVLALHTGASDVTVPFTAGYAQAVYDIRALAAEHGVTP